ncbi:hypothetical protein ENH_00053690 [Eimeria necatrix]|uniref:Gamma tubulin complex component C-terminal domain-containing protein n=1 Tax=Eimeria necatrix TaxID=51315 RepID=U6MZK5_9EIME|nr:hypothetical protein ENH_00053690 [Eimeria necatrix]CDJ68488.1 hypothetical protein ENH_00053690 [Eimeria necatrix]
MLHFSRHWLHFAHQEVIRPNWVLFYQSIHRCRDVDEFLALLWQCIQQQHDGLFLYDAKEAAAAAAAAASGSSSSSINVQLHGLIQEMHETCTSMASRAEFRFAAVAEQQLRGPDDQEAASEAIGGSSSSSMIVVEEQRQAFRRQMLQLLQLLDSKQSEVRAAAAAAAQAASSSSSRSRMQLDHCLAIRSLRLRLDFNDFYEHQRQMSSVSAQQQTPDRAGTRFPSLLLQQQLAAACNNSSSSTSNPYMPDKRADALGSMSQRSSDEAVHAASGGPVFMTKLQQQLLLQQQQQQQQQQFAEELTRPPTACEASGPPSPLPLGQRAGAASAQ